MSSCIDGVLTALMFCAPYDIKDLYNALNSYTYVLDFDGVLVHRFTQFIDWVSARRELAKALIERGFNVSIVSRYIDPYDLIKLCYGDWGIHEDFNYFSTILEYFELNAIPKLVIDPYARLFLSTLLDLGKKIYVVTLQSSSVIRSFFKLVDIPLDKIIVKARDSGSRPKPYVDQLENIHGPHTVVIGDSCTDGYLAKNLNSWFIALDTNGYTYYELCHVGAVAVFNNLEELLKNITGVHRVGDSVIDVKLEGN